MNSSFKEFEIDLDLHTCAKAAKKCKKYLLKHAIKTWFKEAEELMNKRKGFFPWPKPMTKKEALKATTYYQKGCTGELNHRVVTHWKEEIIQLNNIITLSKNINKSQKITLKSDFAAFLILFFDKE